MTYLDTSVVVAWLLAEDQAPPAEFWKQPLVSSRLLEYETWTRIHSRRLGASHGGQVRELLNRVAMVELAPPVLARALEPFPLAVRTLDALHLSTILFLRDQRQAIELASYDERLLAAARRLKVPVWRVGDPPTWVGPPAATARRRSARGRSGR